MANGKQTPSSTTLPPAAATERLGLFSPTPAPTDAALLDADVKSFREEWSVGDFYERTKQVFAENDASQNGALLYHRLRNGLRSPCALLSTPTSVISDNVLPFS